MLELVHHAEPPLSLDLLRGSPVGDCPDRDFIVEGLDAEVARAAVQGRVARRPETRVRSRREDDGTWSVIFSPGAGPAA